jgi:ATP-binding cassette subfamily F protein uup
MAEKILQVDRVSKRFGGFTALSDVSIDIAAGERFGLIGPNGSGKTTLLRALLGQHQPAAGKVTVGQNTRIAYFDQLRSGLENEKSIFDNVGADQSRIELGGEVIEVRSYLERFGFDSHQQRQPVGSLSGGERARVALAKMLRQSANLVVMDEPTNDLDVATLGALEGMLVEYSITALIVTHDRWFLDRVATDILAFEGEGRVVRYPGNYATFCRLRAEAREQRAAAQEAAPAKVVPGVAQAERSARKQRALSRAEERELGELPDAIDGAEKAVAELDRRLADPTTYSERGAEVPQLLADLEKAKAHAAKLTDRWEELETKKVGA